MGRPMYIAIPSEADFAAFSALCTPTFANGGYAAFRNWIARENEAKQARHVRTVEVPLDIEDLTQWLGGRRLNEVLWFAYTATRASQADAAWPPVTRPSTIGGESDFIDMDRDPSAGCSS